MNHIRLFTFAFVSIACCSNMWGNLINVANSGFEDTSGQNVFNEFTFGVPVGWQVHDPNNITPSIGVFTGTLEPNGIDFFDSTAPEGDRVSILFNSSREGDGEYGYIQMLTDTLQANTHYELSVEVGNIGSGVAQNGAFFDLSEFPGYRVELLAGGQSLAQDLNSLTIPERQWGTSIVQFTTGASHAQMGQALGIRLVNLNVIPDGFTQATSPDLEVDFDNVRLNAQAVPEPSGTAILTSLLCVAFASNRRRRKT